MSLFYTDRHRLGGNWWEKDLSCFNIFSVYRNGTKYTLRGVCGNPYTCVKSKWIRSSDQCRWKGKCLDLDDKREGWICRKDRAGVPRMFPEKRYTWYRDVCHYIVPIYKNGVKRTLPYACGNPHTCVHGKWIPQFYRKQ
ncbi:hypothetical protein PoB_002795300 [Plakobranchus ocellatus]|uniref:Uncharacterized protein n=1 Tax=Plakobranchus ocellatus TaxID=259542 RepID=A0AAV4A2R2_9GAST|nr:hypothetical protein PoB_002795300 [Plakobranchus ocellatus]